MKEEAGSLEASFGHYAGSPEASHPVMDASYEFSYLSPALQFEKSLELNVTLNDNEATFDYFDWAQILDSERLKLSISEALAQNKPLKLQ